MGFAERLGTRGGERAGRSRGEPEGRDAGADWEAPAGAPPLRSAHTRKQRESFGTRRAWESGPAGVAKLAQTVGRLLSAGRSRGGSRFRSIGAARLSSAAAQAKWWRRPIGLFPWEAGERVRTLAPAGSLSHLRAFERPQSSAGERAGLSLNKSEQRPFAHPSQLRVRNTSMRVG